ncbi:Helix-turn-helix domain-containing protein [Nonomuraea solani]|uniref:Helix-turn-helix domain-containing protein n=1 Tax=Nonomuraea solani TaxID=1144553 RepID=A0A1H6CP74_9ACTN|nr:helix-turn-helix transcriptional regulator [Nonomuraea solani]SEG74246.1 Helix-turn-helix domain-containing protein [Nonomuraea solani]
MIGEINPILRRRKLATELRRLREDLGFNGVQVSQALHWSTSKLSRLETGQVAPSAKDVARLLRHYEAAGDEAGLLLELAGNHAPKGWWESYSDVLAEVVLEYIGLEDGATSIRAWNNNVLPGLLQTRAYATEMAMLYRSVELAPPTVIERRTRARMRRQQLLMNERLSYTAVVEEAALRRRFGGADAALMHEQLRHLLKLSDQPNITIRMLLLEQPHPIDLSSFVHLGFPSMPLLGPISGDVVYTEDYPALELIEAEERVYRYSVFFDLLCDAALDEEASRDRIASLAGL